jgi:NitT/TauT family transport system substrate-binding protein
MAAPLVVVENFRAMFYAPFYLAHTTGAYADEGVSVVLQSSASPAESARRLGEGSAEIMWGGPLRVLIDHDRNPASELQCFCPVVCRDPFFVIGRTPKPNFTFADLTTVRLGTVSEVPTPWICLAHDVRSAGIDPASLDRRRDASMADNAGALRRGELDAVQLFQPYAEHLLADGAGHVWYAAANRGPTAYTTFVARKAVLESRRIELAAMTSAMAKTLRRIAATPGAALAPLLRTQFPDLAPEVLAACIDRYKALGLWSADPTLLRGGFDWLRAAMLAAGTIQREISFEACVDNGLM